MARVVVTFASLGSPASERGAAPALRLGTELTEILTSSGTSKATTNAAPAAKKGALGFSDGCFATVTATGGDVWVAAGGAPVAAIPAEGAGGTGFCLLAGQTRDFALAAGDKIAVINLPAA